MVNKFLQIKQFEYFFYFMILSISILIVINSNFGIIDDHGLLDTILVGKDMPLFIIPAIGRFFPLNGYELNVISYFSISPTAFYIYNSFQFLVIIILVYKMLVELIGEDNQNIAILFILLLIFTPGFVTSFLRLFVPERSQFFFLIIFLFSFIKYQNKQKLFYVITGLLAANLSLYYKEPTFIMLGAFASLHLIFGWKELNIKKIIFDFLLIVSSVIWISAYYFIVYINKGASSYGEREGGQTIIFIKNIINYIHSDPILIFFIFILLYRLFHILITKKIKFNYMYDSLLLSACLYFAVLLKLNIYAYHYALPVYSFALIGTVVLILKYKCPYIKPLIGLILGIAFISSVPISIHSFAFYKNTSHGFQNTISFLKEYVKDKDYRVDIYLDGCNPGEHAEVYKSFIKYLDYNQITAISFDMKSNEDFKNYFGEFNSEKDSLFTVFKTNKKSVITNNDLLIITPYTYKNITSEYLSLLNKKYKLIFSYEPMINIQDYSIKAILKNYLDSNSHTNLISSKNSLKKQNFYIYLKI